ncbi:hypothetical protein CGQ24_09310 [Arthrobacter sp. 7749]|nr:hypothetical protein CGQ24_09310 [Arthrobacter sp. 7749]
MLAQILPGFRDFRTPLVTGYLWLTVIWILIGAPLPDGKSTVGLMGIINAFGSFLSPAIYLTVLSFVAYVVGMITTINTTSGGLDLLFSRFSPSKGMQDDERIDEIVRSSIRKAKRNNVPPASIVNEFEIEPFYKSKDDYEIRMRAAEGKSDLMKSQYLEHSTRQLQPLLSKSVGESIPALAVKLQEKNKDLFDNYDKDKSEAEFRLSIAGPLAILSVQIFIISWGSAAYYWPWASIIGLLAVVMLIARGLAKRSSATNVVITALEIGNIQSSELERLADLYPTAPAPKVA